jgi:glycosyltransferase involved in cell wall biosynthesis
MVGGVPLAVHYLAQTLSGAGHEVAVLAPGKGIGKMGYRFDSLKQSDRNVSPEEVLFKNLDEEKKRFDFDMLHAHFAWPAGFAAARWGEINNIPTVITCHGIDVNTDRRLDYGYRLRDDLSQKIKTTLKKASAVVCVSQFLAEKAVEAGCAKNKLCIIPNGVKLDEFSQSQSESPVEPYILFLGNLRPLKGVDLLISAFERIAGELKDINLYLVGDGSEKMSLVKTAVREPLLSGRVQFFKQATGKEKTQLFANCLFFVCPSRVEAFPIVNLEAMASAKPVIAFDVGGIGELIDNGKTGFLIPPYDIDSFAEAMQKLITDHKLRMRMSRACRMRIRNYDWKYIAAQYIDLFSSLRDGNFSPSLMQR